ncbi:MAG TPA: hypothetical protein VG963_08015, partial [Polyangiaceae bacterium]|nr:hypothetical protein [Polyangiaceae bacterium]
GTFGPYLGALPDGRSLLLWAAMAPAPKSAGDPQSSAPARQRRWFSVVLDAKGAPQSAVRSLAEAPNDLSLAKVVATRDGFLALAVSLSGNVTRIEALSFGRTGELLAGPTLIDQSQTEVVWVDALGVGDDEVALWANVARGSADIHLARLDARGLGAVQPVQVLEGAKAWQAVAFGDGIALAASVGGVADGPPGAMVTAPASQTTGASDAVRLALLDADGHALTQTDIASGRHLEPQLEAARAGDHLVLAWIERVGLERRLILAAAGSDGQRLAPATEIGTLGSQRLVGFVSSADSKSDAFLAWEDEDQAPRGERRVQIARVSPSAEVRSARAELSLVAEQRERPELARMGNGLAALTRAPACPRNAEGCSPRDAAPTFVEFGAELEALASEPIRLAAAATRASSDALPAGLAELAWGLHCNAETCAALAALPQRPVPIYGVELRPRSSAWLPAGKLQTSALPRATEMHSLVELEPLRDVAAVPSGDAALVVSLTQFDENTPYVKRKTPAPDGRLAPLRALLTARVIGRNGEPSAHLENVSYRARSTSGISLAPASDGHSLLLWTALDQEHPEVFGTLLDRSGKTVLQRELTKGAGQVSQVAAAAVSSGFLAAWISEAGGGGHAFTARLGADLSHPASPRELGVAAGKVRALGLLGRGSFAWLAMTRRAGEQGEVLSLLRLDAASAAPKGDEIVIARSEAGTLLSPVLVAKGDGLVLGWVERAPAAADGGGVWLVEIDAGGKPKAEPVRLATNGEDPSAVRLSCSAERCLALIDARPASGPALEAVVWPTPANGAEPAASSIAPELLLRRALHAGDPAAYSFAGGQLFYADRREQYGRLRRASIDWH